MTSAAPGSRIPRIVAGLGYGGLVPFIALALIIVLDRANAARWDALLRGYGAVILSFVGALHWGFAMRWPAADTSRRDALYLWSVVPALIGFGALLLNPLLGSILLVVGFAAHYWRDRLLVQQAELPGWYLPLRFRLSAVAVVCLGVGAAVVG